MEKQQVILISVAVVLIALLSSITLVQFRYNKRNSELLDKIRTIDDLIEFEMENNPFSYSNDIKKRLDNLNGKFVE